MWREPARNAPFISLSDYVSDWWDGPRLRAAIAQYGSETAADALAQGRELVASQPRGVLLHGDFHPGNVLAAQREPWLFIDPKPLVGDPAYDLAQWLYNRSRFLIKSDDPVAALRTQIDRFATDLDLEPVRIAGWAFVKAVGWQCEPQLVTLLQRVARSY
jgi:streptomycin 6-kinase